MVAITTIPQRDGVRCLRPKWPDHRRGFIILVCAREHALLPPGHTHTQAKKDSLISHPPLMHTTFSFALCVWTRRITRCGTPTRSHTHIPFPIHSSRSCKIAHSVRAQYPRRPLTGVRGRILRYGMAWSGEVGRWVACVRVNTIVCACMCRVRSARLGPTGHVVIAVPHHAIPTSLYIPCPWALFPRRQQQDY